VKKKIPWLFPIVLLLLDWPSLDDITTGKEPDLTGEYLVLALSIPLLLAILFLLSKKSGYS